jgi:predicted dehydrogenase
MLDLAPVVLYQGKDNARIFTEFEAIDADWASGFHRSSAHFVEALRSGAPAAMSAAEAAKVLQLCFAVYQASDTRQPVDPRTITGSVTPAGWGEW